MYMKLYDDTSSMIKSLNQKWNIYVYSLMKPRRMPMSPSEAERSLKLEPPRTRSDSRTRRLPSRRPNPSPKRPTRSTKKLLASWSLSKQMSKRPKSEPNSLRREPTSSKRSSRLIKFNIWLFLNLVAIGRCEQPQIPRSCRREIHHQRSPVHWGSPISRRKAQGCRWASWSCRKGKLIFSSLVLKCKSSSLSPNSNPPSMS